MRGVIARAWTVALLAAGGVALAQATGPNPAGTRVLGTHQIDRFAAIEQVRAALEADSRNLHDWIILGELAQEVARDVPASLAPGYYTLAHEAYEGARKLAPEDTGLKAAAAFTREEEQRAEQAAQARRRAVGTYLETRRRELAQPGAVPTVRVYANPAPASPYYYYQPYASGEGQSYTYQQHRSTQYYPEDDGIPARPQPGQFLTATERAALVKPAAKFAPP
jgi:hypothetical protein